MSEPITEPPAVVTPPAPPAFTAITSQEDFDRAVQDRLARQRAQFKDYDDLKTKAAEFDKLSEAAKSEAQREKDRADKAEAAATEAVQRAVKAEVKAIATGEFADPSDAALYLGDLSKFVKDGDADPDAIEAALKEVLKAKPHLAVGGRTDAGLGVRSGTTAATPNQQMNEQIRRSAGRQ